MVISNSGKYQVVQIALPEFSSASFKNPTGRVFEVSEFIILVRFQENIPGVAEWGQLDNGNWVPALQNGKMRVKFVAPATPAPLTAPQHVIKVDAEGRISVDGLPYE